MPFHCLYFFFSLSGSHQAVSLQGFDQSAVCVLVQVEALGDVAQKIQVLESWLRLLSLLLGRSSLVR